MSVGPPEQDVERYVSEDVVAAGVEGAAVMFLYKVGGMVGEVVEGLDELRDLRFRELLERMTHTIAVGGDERAPDA